MDNINSEDWMTVSQLINRHVGIELLKYRAF